LAIPPPSPAELPVKVQLLNVGEEEWFHMPPPLPAKLLEKVQLVSVGKEDE
jgi:hypothetical protein